MTRRGSHRRTEPLIATRALCVTFFSAQGRCRSSLPLMLVPHMCSQGEVNSIILNRASHIPRKGGLRYGVLV